MIPCFKPTVEEVCLPPNAVIFDMDGVLFDSDQLHHRAYAEALAPYNLYMSIEWFRAHAPGVSRRDVLEKFSRECSVEIDISSVVQAKGEAVASLLPVTEPNLAIGVREGLEELALEFDLAVATSSTMGPELVGWAGLSAYFPIIVTSADVPNGKPAPDIYLEAAKRLGHVPKTCVVVEDSAVGIEGAKRAGMTVIGFAMGSTSGLQTAGFQAVRFSEIIEHVRSI